MATAVSFRLGPALPVQSTSALLCPIYVPGVFPLTPLRAEEGRGGPAAPTPAQPRRLPRTPGWGDGLPPLTQVITSGTRQKEA